MENIIIENYKRLRNYTKVAEVLGLSYNTVRKVCLAQVQDIKPTRGKDYSELLKYYQRVRSYTKTAKKFNISRQRVDQIVRKLLPDVLPKQTSRIDFLSCQLCKRVYSENERHRRYCDDCKGIVFSGKKYPGGVEAYFIHIKKRREIFNRKTCQKCGKVRDKKGYLGLCSSCYFHIAYEKRKNDPSRITWRKKYYQKNKVKIDESNKSWRLKNKKLVSEFQHKYRLANKEKLVAYAREYYLKNKDKLKEYDRQYRLRKKMKTAKIK